MASAALLRPTMADDDEFVLNLEFAGGKQHAPVQNGELSLLPPSYCSQPAVLAFTRQC
jgi:hypothetical protein